MKCRRRVSVLFPGALLVLLAGCSNPQPTGTPILVDPTTTRREAGGTDDVLQVSQTMLSSMRRDTEVAAKPSKLILLDENGITVDPKLGDYNARMLYNQFQANLNKAAGGEFKFLDRNAVRAERARQLGGEAATSGVGPAAGADMILTIELIAMQGGNTTTVQYSFKLTDVKDGSVLWMDSVNLVKRS